VLKIKPMSNLRFKNKESKIKFIIRKSIDDLKYLNEKEENLNPESMDIVQSIKHDLNEIIKIYLVN
jgi:hypothetical protein